MSGLVVSGLKKSYASGREDLLVLDGVDFDLTPGDSLAVMGPSGSGKSTLLHILGALDRPDSGRVTLDGEDPFSLGRAGISAFRNRKVGFVFQDHHLLPQLTALENALVPTLVAAGATAEVEAWARSLLERMGLGHRLEHYPAELSGGERQRVALARALVLRPRLLLCDEPTGNLDAASSRAVADLLLDLHRETQGMLVLVTHSSELASRFSRHAELRGGRLADA